jgi:hypothetical protein
MKSFIFSILFILSGITLNAVPDSLQNYFATKTDTVLCKALKYGTTAQGWLSWITYTDMSGKEVSL